MNRRTLTFLAVCSAIGITHWSPPAAGADSEAAASKVESLLSRLPAPNAAVGREVNAEFVELGPAAVAEICARLVPPGTGDDTKSRYALDGLSTYVHRPRAEAERLMFAGSLIKALEYATDDEIRAFLIRQLERVGREESLATLAELLTDDRLGEPATRALVTIGTPGAAKRLLKALPSATGSRKVTIINGIGSLRATGATEALVRLATTDAAAVRRAALAALAATGHPAAEETLARAAQSTAGRERTHAAAVYLLYAQRLAESGRKETCARICRHLLATRLTARERNVACTALTTLVGAVGKEASDELLRAMDSEFADYQGVALSLAPSIPGKAFTARWVEKMRHVSPELRAPILAMLGERGDSSALPAVREALLESDVAVKFAAIQATGRLEKKPALTILLAVIEAARGEEKAKLFPLLRDFGGQQALDAVVAGTKSSDAAVEEAAVRALADWPEARALGDILVVFTGAESAARRRLVLDAYMRLVRGAGRSREHVLVLYKDALAAARNAAEKKVILGGLSRLKSSGSLELVTSFLDDETLQMDAAAAVVSIIRPRRSGRGGLRGEAAIAALRKVIAIAGDDGLRQEAESVLKKLESPRRRNN